MFREHRSRIQGGFNPYAAEFSEKCFRRNGSKAALNLMLERFLAEVLDFPEDQVQ